MKPGDEEEAWRQIVENYGEPAVIDAVEEDSRLEDPPPIAPPIAPPTVPTSSSSWEVVTPEPVAPEPVPEGPDPDPIGRLWADEGRFVPPPLEPIPLAEPKRLAAWVGMLGVPVLFLLSVFVGGPFPGWLTMLLLAWCLGGFGYLVWTMPKRRDDPWDDGSRI